MKHSTKETDEIEKVNEDFSQAEDIPSRPNGFIRLLKPVLITVLSLLCLSGGIVLHKIHSIDRMNHTSKKYADYTPSSSLTLLKENTAAPTDNPLKTISPIKTVQNTPEISQIEPMISEPIPSSETPQQSLQAEEIITNPETEPLPVQKEIKKQIFLEGFSLKDALKFKENFLAENQCKEDYQKLLNVPNKTNEVLTVLSDLSPYCQNNQKPVQNVLEAFLKNKKEALIVYYKENNPPWLAYLKSIPISLIEIRRMNPVKRTPKNILYKAQNELIVQNVENAVNLVTTLPLSMQQKMNDFYREASIYNRAIQSLDQLILSFERKGE